VASTARPGRAGAGGVGLAESAGLTQEQLAHRLHAHCTSVLDMEARRNRAVARAVEALSVLDVLLHGIAVAQLRTGPAMDLTNSRASATEPRRLADGTTTPSARRRPVLAGRSRWARRSTAS